MTEAPKLLRDMTDAEIGALVRSKSEGKDIQALIGVEWMEVASRPCWSMGLAYRIKPEPVQASVILTYDRSEDVYTVSWPYGSPHSITAKNMPEITLNFIDGEPTGIRMERIK